MKVNVDKVLERDAKLSELDSRAGKILHSTVCLSTLTMYSVHVGNTLESMLSSCHVQTAVVLFFP